jgi:hypothetical protein
VKAPITSQISKAAEALEKVAPAFQNPYVWVESEMGNISFCYIHYIALDHVIFGCFLPFFPFGFMKWYGYGFCWLQICTGFSEFLGMYRYGEENGDEETKRPRG